MTRPSFLPLFGVLLGALLLACAVIPAGGMAANQASDMNNLGMVTRVCSAKFCDAGVNSLDLWLSLEEACMVNSQPYLQALVGSSASESGGMWSSTITGFMCAVAGAAGVFAGFQSGSRFGARHKNSYPVA